MPGPPEPIDIEADTIVLVWDPPRHDGGSKITGYELQARKWRDEVYSPGEQINMKMERGELKGLDIDPSIFNGDDKEVVEDLILAAIKDAQTKAAERSQAEMAKLTESMGLPADIKLPF